jgi:hypothetical protein
MGCCWLFVQVLSSMRGLAQVRLALVQLHVLLSTVCRLGSFLTAVQHLLACACWQ